MKKAIHDCTKSFLLATMGIFLAYHTLNFMVANAAIIIAVVSGACGMLVFGKGLILDMHVSPERLKTSLAAEGALILGISFGSLIVMPEDGLHIAAMQILSFTLTFMSGCGVNVFARSRVTIF